MEKYIKDGKVAVLYSPRYGAGWSTWAGKAATNMAMDTDLISAFIEGGKDALVSVAEKKYPDAYLGGAENVKIEWIPLGVAFRVKEYDGFESIEIIGEIDHWVA